MGFHVRQSVRRVTVFGTLLVNDFLLQYWHIHRTPMKNVRHSTRQLFYKASSTYLSQSGAVGSRHCDNELRLESNQGTTRFPFLPPNLQLKLMCKYTYQPSLIYHNMFQRYHRWKPMNLCVRTQSRVVRWQDHSLWLT